MLSIIEQHPPIWLVLPFILLLGMIATGAILFPVVWHKYYKQISATLGLIVVAYYVLVQHNMLLPVETLSEYISFISLLTLLYVASGGIYIFVDVESKTQTNLLFLFIAALLTNIIGTTGASVLLIRPFMQLNRSRLKTYHIVFFIFIVSNAGGLLTPIGDPPLFMGFLKGIPFSWPFTHLWPVWLMTITLLLAVFCCFEKMNTKFDAVDNSKIFTNKISINGNRNFIWLAICIVSVFLDPTIIDGLPYIDLQGKKLSYIREMIQLISAFFCYKYANKTALNNNRFNFEAIKEVAFLFFGIFLCMMPAIQSLEAYAYTNKDSLTLTPALVYWSGGIFSSVLDNAPIYLNMLALILSNAGLSIHHNIDVQQFLKTDGVVLIEAISVSCVFFGAMTYIGNGPNFIVKAIAEQEGIKMPGFGQYIWRFSLPVLMPVLILVWVVFYL